jgi:dTDP-4-amino-4,6-dideoxygalactose transaminase
VDGDVYWKLMLYSLHGQSKDALAKTQLGAWEYDIVAPYYKYNMTDIMAAIGGVQLKRYPSILARRRQIIGMYTEGLADCPVTVLGHYGDQKQDIVLHGSNSANGDGIESSGHLYLVNLVGRDGAYRNKVIEELAVRGVATNVHYKPLPMHTAYKDLGFSIEDYPNSYGRFINEITLPLHTLLTDDQVEYVIECFRGVLYGA